MAMIVLLSKKVFALEQGSENLNRNLRENTFSVNQKKQVNRFALNAFFVYDTFLFSLLALRCLR
jgi:hypothetical protein